MTLTPASIRLDLKCGNGSISPGEKCTKGTAQSSKKTNKLRTAARIAAIGGAAVGAGYIIGRSGLGAKAGAALRNTASDIGATGQQVLNARKSGVKTQLKALKYAGSNIRGRGKLRQLQNRPMPEPDTLYGRVVDPWKSGESSELLDKARASRAIRGAKRRSKRDSIWATGFEP